jgi:hypothetical protein
MVKILQILIVDIRHQIRELDIVVAVTDSVLNGNREQAAICALGMMNKTFREIDKIVVRQLAEGLLLYHGTISRDAEHGPARRNID